MRNLSTLRGDDTGMSLSKQSVATLVAAGVLALGGIAAAGEGGEDPELDEVVCEVPDECESEDGADGEGTDGTEELKSEDDEDELEEAGSGEHPDNHGSAVSAAAHECHDAVEAGDVENHGECVREVAKSDAGKDAQLARRAAHDAAHEGSDGDEGDAGDEAGTGETTGHGKPEHAGSGGKDTGES